MNPTKFLWILSLNVIFLIGSVTATDGSVAASSVTGVVADLDAVNTTALHLIWDSPTKNPNITIERYEIEVDNEPRVKIPSDNETSSYNYMITVLEPGKNYSVTLIVVYTQEIEATTVAQETTQEIETTTVAQATTTVTVLDTTTTSALTTQSTVLSTATVASELRETITLDDRIYLFNNTYPETPTGIILTGRDTKSLTFTWNQVGQADDCYMWTDDATMATSNCSFHSDGSATGTISGLPVAGKEYTVQIAAVSGGLNSDEVSTTPERTLPPNPSAPQCISQTNVSFTFEILPPFDHSPDSFELDEYEVVVISSIDLFPYNTTTSLEVANKSSTIQRTIDDVDIVAGVTYGITLTSIIAGVSSAGSNSSKCVTEPNAPIINGIVETTEVMVNATWQTPSGYFDGFNVSCVGQDSVKNAFAINYQNQTSSDTSKQLFAECHNVTAGALYQVNVVSILFGQSLTSSASDLVSNVTVPYAPTKVEPTNATTTNLIQLSVTYGYTESDSQCTHFEVSNLTDTETIEKTETIPASNPTVDFLDLTPDSRYKFNTSATSNYTQLNSTLWRRSSNSTSTIAWTLAPSVSNITGLEREPWSLFVQFDQTDPHEHVWKYTIHVDAESGRIQTIDLLCDGATDVALTELNCDQTNPDVQKIPIDCGTRSSCDSTTVFPESTQGVAEVTTVTDFKATTTTVVPEDVTTSTMVARLLEASTAQSICFNISDLQPYISYSISVQAVNPGGCSVKESVALVTSEWIPGCVDIIYSNASYDSIEVYWNPPDKPNGIITQYVINYTRQDGTSDINTTTTKDTFYIIESLEPHVAYNITVVAETSVGVGASIGCPLSNTSIMTSIGKPYQPTLELFAIDSTSINISWSLARDVQTGPDTYYNLTITDTVDVTLILKEHVEGFDTRSIVVGGLDEYWEYRVGIVAYTIDGSGKELPTEEETGNIYTMESTPGPVQFLNATSLISMNMCYRARVAWDLPAERDRNGVIIGFKLTWSEVNVSYISEATYHGGTRRTDVDVEPNGKAYKFTIKAETSVGYGTNVSYVLDSTGICGPAPLNVETVFGVSPDYTQTSFTVVYDSLVFSENDNGQVVASAILVAQETGNQTDTEEVHGGQELFNGAIKWKDAIDVNPIPEYRPTPDGWLNDSSGSVSRRQRRELSATYIVGNDGSCSKESDVYCNGPLQPGRNYRVRGVICTQENMCYKTRFLYNIFITANADESLAWIAGVVIGIVVLIALIILLLYFLKKKRQSPYEAKDDNGGREIRDFPVPPQEMAKPVRVIDFSARVIQMHRNSDLEFNDEYQLIQNQSARLPWTAAEKPKNRVKNRFVNILPFDHSRVTLRGSDNDPDDSESDYINANYIPTIRGIREFIACQGPLESTKDDFWQMVWEHDCRVIVMLTNLKERGREKCAQYWPERQNEPSRFRNDIYVDLITESTTDQYAIRKFKVWTGTQTREVFQFHFVSWPDFGVPDDPEKVLSFIRMVRKYAGNNVDPPMVVHCSAGVGRTGTFIVLDRLLRELPRAETIDIFSMVLQLRENRCLMVQTEAQYVFIHDCMKLEIERTLGYNNHTYDDFDESSFNDEEIYQNAGELANNLQTFAHD